MMENDPINENLTEGYDSTITKQPLVGETNKEDNNVSNLPVGMQRLSRARTVTISQLIDPVEVMCCCFARPCRYSVHFDEDTELCLYIQEVSECYARQIMGAARNFGLKFTDTDNIDDIRVVRPQTCSRGCCGICCVLPSLEVQSPPGSTIAVIKERRTCLCPLYDIVDRNDEIIFTLNPAYCYLGLVNLCCMNIEINITDRNGELAATLCKKTRGSLGECTGAANDFSINFLQDLPVLQKASILGSVFLVDFHYFERQNRCCC